MAATTDVKAKTMTATGAAGVGGARTRVRGIYYVAAAGAGSISFKDGGSGGTELISVATPASATATGNIIIPAEGVLFQADPYLTLTNVTSVTFFYG